VQRINVGHVANINTRTIETFNPSQVVYVNRGAPRGATFVPRDVFVQSRPAGVAFLTLSAADITRAPLMGMTAKVVPQRESIIAKPMASRPPVAQPQPGRMSGRVYSRVAPPPVQVPFAQQQQLLKANPGQPVDPAVLSGIQRRQQPVSRVTIVNPATLTTLKKPPVLRNAPPTPAPAGQQKPATPAPTSQQPVVRQAPNSQQKPVAPAPTSQQPVVRQTPNSQQKPVTPAPSSQQPVVRQTPGSQQKPVTPAPSSQQPVARQTPGSQQKPATTAPTSQQPVVRQTPGSQQKPVAPATSSQQPVVRQASNSQQRGTAPAAVVKEKPTVTAPPPGKQPPASASGGQKGSSAATLITTLKTRTLPDADRSLSEARKVAGIRIDLNAIAGQLAAAKESLAGAERDLAGGNSDRAAQEAAAVQQQIDNQMNQLSAAEQTAKQGAQKR
jgi:hypothetical protein